MKNKRIIIFISIVFVIISLIISFIFYYVFFSVKYFNPSEYYPYDIWLSQSKNDNNYTIIIKNSSPTEIDTNELYWRILDQDSVLLYENDFPTLSGEEGSISNKNITVIWYDNDLNSKLSKNDNIIIKSENYNLTRYSFNIVQIMDKYFYETISQIDLE